MDQALGISTSSGRKAVGRGGRVKSPFARLPAISTWLLIFKPDHPFQLKRVLHFVVARLPTARATNNQ